jgi:tetratricopeptide (TPR) repeat protein
MKNFLRQLQQREVLRSAGLYVGICWILIQAADIVLPAFGAANWVFRALIYVAIGGFPIIVVLAWFLDISEKGIAVDDGSTGRVVSRLGGRKLDIAVIALLAVVLAVSLVLNVIRKPEPERAGQLIAISIAAFENRTDDALLDELVEARLAMVVETSPHVFAIEQRHGGSQEQGDVVLEGAIDRKGQSTRIIVQGLEPANREELFESRAVARRDSELLGVVERLGRSILSELGAASVSDAAQQTTEFTRSLGAAKAWAQGRSFEHQGAIQDAVVSYQVALDEDPAFGPAHARLAFLEFDLGRKADGKQSWTFAQAHIDRFTERERLALLGTYYLDIVGDSAASLEYFDDLLHKYPAETRIRFDVARAAYGQADFARALTESDRALQTYAEIDAERLRMARYARYAGDIERSISESEYLINKDPRNAAALLQLALAHAAGAQLHEARQVYRKIDDESVYAVLAESGIADLDLYLGRLGTAFEALPDRVEGLAAEGRLEEAALIGLVLADARLLAEGPAGAVTAAQASLRMSDNPRTKISAAFVFVNADASEDALAIARDLAVSTRNTDRAYGRAIIAAQMRQNGEYVEAIELSRQALDLADLWRLHFELGRTYAEAGMFAEAFSELQACQKRRGEAVAMYLDDVPTLRYSAEVYYWLGLVYEGLGMSAAAEETFRAFLKLRPRGGAQAHDAATRLAQLNDN